MKKTRGKSRSNVLTGVILTVGAAALLGLFGWAIWQGSSPAQANQSADQMQKDSKAGCTHSYGKTDLAGMQTALCTTEQHVDEGKSVTYDTDPPLSGDHWPSWVNAGFYAADQPKEKLVHSLEHGNIVIYYNQAKLSDQDLAALKSLTTKYTGQWDGVVAVPRADNQSALILTAWEHALRLDKFDQATIDKFVDAFRGRGPENPVR